MQRLCTGYTAVAFGNTCSNSCFAAMLDRGPLREQASSRCGGVTRERKCRRAFETKNAVAERAISFAIDTGHGSRSLKAPLCTGYTTVSLMTSAVTH